MKTLQTIIENIDNANFGVNEYVFCAVVLAVIIGSCFLLPDANKVKKSNK